MPLKCYDLQVGDASYIPECRTSFEQNYEYVFLFVIADWILLIYKDGTKYKSYCDGQSREAWVKLVCEKSGKVSLFDDEVCLILSAIICSTSFCVS